MSVIKSPRVRRQVGDKCVEFDVAIVVLHGPPRTASAYCIRWDRGEKVTGRTPWNKPESGTVAFHTAARFQSTLREGHDKYLQLTVEELPDAPLPHVAAVLSHTSFPLHNVMPFGAVSAPRRTHAVRWEEEGGIMELVFTIAAHAPLKKVNSPAPRMQGLTSPKKTAPHRSIQRTVMQPYQEPHRTAPHKSIVAVAVDVVGNGDINKDVPRRHQVEIGAEAKAITPSPKATAKPSPSRQAVVPHDVVQPTSPYHRTVTPTTESISELHATIRELKSAHLADAVQTKLKDNAATQRDIAAFLALQERDDTIRSLREQIAALELTPTETRDAFIQRLKENLVGAAKEHDAEICKLRDELLAHKEHSSLLQATVTERDELMTAAKAQCADVIKERDEVILSFKNYQGDVGAANRAQEEVFRRLKEEASTNTPVKRRLAPTVDPQIVQNLKDELARSAKEHKAILRTLYAELTVANMQCATMGKQLKEHDAATNKKLKERDELIRRLEDAALSRTATTDNLASSTGRAWDQIAQLRTALHSELVAAKAQCADAEDREVAQQKTIKERDAVIKTLRLAAAKAQCTSERETKDVQDVGVTIKNLQEELAAAEGRDSRQRIDISERDDLIRKLEDELSESWKMNERQSTVIMDLQKRL